MLDIECLDRVYLNAYVPILQSSGQVVAFMTQHLGLPIPSPAMLRQDRAAVPPGGGLASPRATTSRGSGSPRTTARST